MLLIEVRSRGELCATGGASLPAAAPSFPFPSYVEVAAVAEREPVNATSSASGKWLGAVPRAWPDDAAKEYLADIRETEAIYAREGLGHPGLLPRVMNKVLVDNAIMGPWIHVGTRMQLLSVAGIGDELTARAKVIGNYDKKGHRWSNSTRWWWRWRDAAHGLPACRDHPAARTAAAWWPLPSITT